MKLLLLFVLATQCREMWQELHTNHLLRNTNFDIAKTEVKYWHSTMYSPKNKTYNNNIFCGCSRQFVKMLKYADAFYERLDDHEKSLPEFPNESQSTYCADVECAGESRALVFKCTDSYGVFSYAYQKLDKKFKQLPSLKLEIVVAAQNADQLQFFEQLSAVIISINYYSFPFINYTNMIKQANGYKFIYDINMMDLAATNNLDSTLSSATPWILPEEFSKFIQSDPNLNIFRIYYIESRPQYCMNATNRPTLLISHISLYHRGKYGLIEPWVVGISSLGFTSCLCAGCIFVFKLLFNTRKEVDEISTYHSIV